MGKKEKKKKIVQFQKMTEKKFIGKGTLKQETE